MTIAAKRFMLKRLTSLLILLAMADAVHAQQMIGLTTNNYVAVNQLQLNPAYVNNARFAPEFSLFSISALAGNNAYSVSPSWLLGGAKESAVLGKQYVKLTNGQNKKAWANIDITGPAFSFTYKHQYQFGFYTRFRTIINAGNLPADAFNIYTSDSTNSQYYYHTLEFKKTGAVAHAFGEIGISAGKMLHEDDMYKVSGGVTIKYMMGFAAANMYTKALTYQRAGDSIFYAQGDVNAMYTFNATPSGSGDLSTRAGKGGLGIDIGAQYHYFPNDDPNKEIKYQLSIAASITDIGSVAYIADQGSAHYNVIAGKTYIHDYEFKDADNNELNYYLDRQEISKVVTVKDKVEKFRIGLPTALRINVDYHIRGKAYISFNTLVNLRGNSAYVYRPSYISFLNVTPRIDIYKSLKLGLPITLLRYRDMSIGAVAYLGPLYIGSTTAITSLLGQQMKDIDVYAGLGFRMIKREYDPNSRTRIYDNAYDDPESGIKRFIPRFLRSKTERGILCPPSRN